VCCGCLTYIIFAVLEELFQVGRNGRQIACTRRVIRPIMLHPGITRTLAAECADTDGYRQQDTEIHAVARTHRLAHDVVASHHIRMYRSRTISKMRIGITSAAGRACCSLDLSISSVSCAWPIRQIDSAKNDAKRRTRYPVTLPDKKWRICLTTTAVANFTV